MANFKKDQSPKKNRKKVNEGFWDSLIGPTAAAGLQASGQRGLNTREKLIQNIFVNDFVADAVGALTNAINSGLVDVNIMPAPANQPPSSATSPEVAQAYRSKSTSAATKVPTATATTAQAKPSAPTKPASRTPQTTNLDQRYNSVLGSMRKLSVAPGSRPIPQIVANKIQTDLRNATYNKDWAVSTGTRIADLAKRGYDVRNLRQSWLASQSSGKRKGGVMENYSRLNMLFEQIVEATGGRSIEQFMYDWFARYMSGIDYANYQADVKRLITQIASTYNRDRGVQAIKSLANAAYAISKTAGSVPPENKASNSANINAQPNKTPDLTNIDLSSLDDTQLTSLLTSLKQEYYARKKSQSTAPTNVPNTSK